MDAETNQHPGATYWEDKAVVDGAGGCWLEILHENKWTKLPRVAHFIVHRYLKRKHRTISPAKCLLSLPKPHKHMLTKKHFNCAVHS